MEVVLLARLVHTSRGVVQSGTQLENFALTITSCDVLPECWVKV